MGDIGLFKQGWKWLQCQKQAIMGTHLALGCIKDTLVCFGDRHWPLVYRWCVKLGRFLLMTLFLWWECIVRGFWSLLSLRSTALLLTLWSCFLSLTSTCCLIYVLLVLGGAGATIRYLGYTPGLFIVGLFGILIMWKYGNFWVTGLLFLVGGYTFSLKWARVLILLSTAYSVYCLYVRAGWLGIFLSINLAFLSNDLLIILLQGYDRMSEGTQSEECKHSDPILEDFSSDAGFSATTSEPESYTPNKSSCNMSNASKAVNVQKDTSPSKEIKADAYSVNEMKRIMNSSNHYEVLGFPQNKSIDRDVLRKEYLKKAMLVHPDKNMGNPLASESFKKLQCANEVLSDLTKKRSYDEQLRKEESMSVCQEQRGTSHQSRDGVDYRSEESRRIKCIKCGKTHIWICTTRNKMKARWCQDCCQFHQAKDGDGWVEYGRTSVFSTPQKVEIPRAFVCAESKIFDVSEWAICQGMACKANTHRPSFHVNMVGLDKATQRPNPSRFPWDLDAEMMTDDEDFELWLQQALASGLFSETSKRRKSWSPFQKKVMKPWRRSP